MEQMLPYVAVAAIVYVIACKFLYNGALADEKDKIGDLTILKTLLLAIASTGLAKYIMDKYHAVRVPGHELPTPLSGSAPVPTPIMAHRLSTLVPQ